MLRSNKVLVVAAIVVGVALMAAGCASVQSNAKELPVSSRADEVVPTSGCGHAATHPVGTLMTERIESGGRARTYALHLPTTYRPSTPIPLILAFHARGGSGRGMAAYTGLSDANAVVAYPDGIVSGGQRSWESAPYASDANDVQFVADLVSALQRTLCIDPLRVFAAGKSNGGGFVSLLACELPERIAAFGIVSGAFYEPGPSRCARSIPVPVVEFHGTADTVIRYDGGTSHGTRYLSVAQWLRTRAAEDDCTSTISTAAVAPGVTKLQWTGCPERGALVHYRLDGGGHTWPGAISPSGPGRTVTDVSATKIMLQFFADHPLPNAR